MPEPKTIIAPIITHDGNHVFSNSPKYKEIIEFFMTEIFVDFASFREVDSGMSDFISEHITEYVNGLNWDSDVVATCTDSRAVEMKGSDDIKVVFIIDINTV
jgi:hypothetical protein